MFFKEKAKTSDPVVEDALSAWRDAERVLPGELLSEGARANVRALSRRRAGFDAESGLSSLFLPAGRLAAAAGVPVLLLALFFGWFIRGGEDLGPADAAAPAIETRKIDGQAVFEIANGGRVHRVYRAQSARELAGAELYTTTRGSFSDTLQGESGVVFYRID